MDSLNQPIHLVEHGIDQYWQCSRTWVSYLVDLGSVAGEPIPQDDGTLIVTAGQKVLVITAPADTAMKKQSWD